ncbi:MULTISPECIES: DoxX family protein [Nonomuraea]|uniref:DoxX family protein n=1 Tax=Nonomuraea ferruginea TaxID=46174 RepID=A0ABT4TD40_9ACTN|nr:DoxX family protein [Nonomuraea ferruginea]MDA0647427.1 DoxX family protein [Nonomuraea ferruginea]
MDKGISVFAVYLVITSLASAVVGLAAIANLIGHDYPKKQADQLRVPRSWTLPLGLMLAAGSLGLLAGFAVPVLGLLAAAGLVLYFLGAFCVHLRARDHHFGAWSVFFALVAAALVVNVAYY